MTQVPAIALDATLALVVGIESYPRRPGLELQGPAADAVSFARWLLNRGVPAVNIKVLISTANPTDAENVLAGVEVSSGLVTMEQVTGTLEKFRHTHGQCLLIFWSGHGIMTADQIRRPLLANYSDADKHNLNLESLQEHLRSTMYGYPAFQIMLFDMCATLFDERLRRESLADFRFQSGPVRPDCQQYLLYAAADRQVAENLTGDKTGLYFRELIKVLEEELDWPPNMQRVVDKMEQRFADLRGKSATAQEPIYQYWRGPSGRAETKYLGGKRSIVNAAARAALMVGACVAASLIPSEFGLALSPPWPNRWVVALATIPIPFLVFMAINHWCRTATEQQVNRLLRRSIATAIGSLIVYLILFVQFTHPLPDHWHREIGGFTYTQKAQWYRDANVGISDRELIQDMGNNVDAVFGQFSLGLMRIILLGTWIALFVTSSSTVLLLLQLHLPVKRLE